MIDKRVYAICEEFNVKIIDGRAYPEIGETRAIATMDRILRNRGEDHFRIVMMTLAETSNNKACLDEFCFWAVSDLVLSYLAYFEQDAEKWLSVFDAMPLGEIQFMARDMSGIVPQRGAIAGMACERIVRAFGPLSLQPDLFDDRARAA